MGVSAVSSQNGEGVFDPQVLTGVSGDNAGIKSAKVQLDRAIELLELIYK